MHRRLALPAALALAFLLLPACGSKQSTDASEGDGTTANAQTKSASDGATMPAKERSFVFTYRAAPKDLPDDAGMVRAWVPVPISWPAQDVHSVTVRLEAGGASVERPLAEASKITTVGSVPVDVQVHDITHGKGTSLYVGTHGQPVTIQVVSDVTRRETHGGPDSGPSDLQAALEPDHMIPLQGRMSEVASQLPDKGSTQATAKELFEYVRTHMKYDKPKGGKWGRGDAVWACDNGYGNCTDFHSFFIGLARVKKVPGWFQIGFPLPPDGGLGKIGGYHCWAWYHDADAGWVPVDISEARKHPEKADYLFGTLDCDRMAMTAGRDLVLEPAPAAGALNFFVYPYFEVDGKPWTSMDKSFSVSASKHP
jgi:transglutaminase-like putative cysteine protease